MPETSMWCSTRSRAERLALAALLAACLVCPAQANTGAGASASAAAPVLPGTGGHPQLAGSRLQGEATLRFFGMRVYSARLWTLPDFRSDRLGEQPLVLELDYLRDLKGSAIAERSLQEMRRVGSFNEAQGQRWLEQMQRIFPDVKAGDRLTGQLLPGQGAAFWHNGRPTGRVPEAEFATLFFGIWLSPATSEPDMRLALLGQATGSRR